ncbi:hypothetical protein Pcinc_011933 [Petrolisthes cinctipes]|uniref:Transient receptor potential cation channel subfamily A member 1 n=1 Tax=Petrolisthes cinctipes TaxID=88211 RepID=A0AAE1G1N4_PETCI|nr:hypothetical protein Pcinc_011933 [Petrolisthes cinctipes]
MTADVENQKVSLDLEPHADLSSLATAVNKLTDDDVPRNEGLITYCKKLVERERPASSCFLDLIYDDTSSELVLKTFLKGITSDEAVASSNSLYGKHSVLYMAVDTCNELRVQTLLSYKASPWREEPTGELPLHRAAERGHKNIFHVLLCAMKGEASKVDLQNYTMSLMETLMENWKRNTDHADCYKRLFEADIELNLNEEHIGRTAVHVAASFNKQEAVSNLLQHGAFLGARPWLTEDTQCPSVLPSLKASTLEKAMAGCIKHLPHSNTQQESEDLNNDNHTLLLDYRFLLPPDAANQDVNEVATLMDISRSKHHRRVIKHPLVRVCVDPGSSSTFGPVHNNVASRVLELSQIHPPLIVAFTISFNMLLQQPQSSEGNDKEFQDFGSTLPKAIVMSTGEFEYSSLKEHFSNNSLALASTVLMFLIFLFLIFLVLMNVMNALAITDTQEVVDDAELYSLMSRLELVYLIEAVLLWCLSKCYTSVLKSHLGSLQLLSGHRYSCRLLAKINRTEKKQRLLVGKISEDRSKFVEENPSPSKLDDTTAQCLRNHRMVYLEGLEAEEREDRMNAMLRVENLLRSVVKESPEDVKRILAAVKSGQ